jgi:tetrahydromethanopterin S-methyltransferase subunit A
VIINLCSLLILKLGVGRREMKEFNKVAAEVVGELCKILLPIKAEYYFGAGKEIAICTLSSLNLLTQISEDHYLMEKIAMVGRLLSENKGIDAIIKYSTRNQYLKHIVVCGVDTRGHLAGHALLSLYRNGMDLQGRILSSKSPRPEITIPRAMVENFRKKVRIYDLFGVTDLDTIKEHVDKIQ